MSKKKVRKCNALKDIWMPDYLLRTTRENVIRITLRKLLIYITYLIITCIVVFSMLPSLLYTFTKVLEAQFIHVKFEAKQEYITFTGIKTAEDFWRYTEFIINNNLYNEFWYGSFKPIANITDDDDKKVLFENKILGVPRLRQLRVRNDSCEIHVNFHRTFLACYNGFSKESEDTNDFGPANTAAWTYHSHEDLKGSYYWGHAATYHGGGFYQDFSLEKSESLAYLKELERNLWITRNTRVIFLDFTLYNGNINLFSVIKLVFEFPPTGGCLPSSTFYTVKLIRYVTGQDFFILGCELLFICFTIYYTVQEILEIIYYKRRYFRFWFNYIDLIIIPVSYICVAFNIYRYIFVRNQVLDIQNNPDLYMNFEFVGYWQTQFNNTLGIILFLQWIKIFKFINLSRTLGQLHSTLSRCFLDIVGFSIMFFIIFLAFSQVGYLLFGSQIERFSTFGNSILTLLMTILGEFDYYEINKTNKILAPIFFITYIFFVFFVLFNMFLAIITDTYSEVKNELDLKKNELEMFDFIKRAPYKLVNKFNKNFFSGMEYLPGNAIIDDIRKILEICKFSDLEMEIFFSLYNIDPKKVLTENEIRKFLLDLKNIKTDVTKGKNKKPLLVTNDEFSNQQHRLESLDDQLQMVKTKVDSLLLEVSKYIEKTDLDVELNN